jgi:hypothetical protein
LRQPEKGLRPGRKKNCLSSKTSSCKLGKHDQAFPVITNCSSKRHPFHQSDLIRTIKYFTEADFLDPPGALQPLLDRPVFQENDPF